MKVGYYQFDCAFGEVKRNLDQVSQALATVTADLIVLPELFASGYQFVSQQEATDLSESVPSGPTTQRLLELAKARTMVLVGGLPERAGDRVYNSAVAVGPKGVIGCYRKTHLFFEETLFFAPGDSGFQVWDIGPARIGVMVCFDWFYPEAARTLALKGATSFAILQTSSCPTVQTAWSRAAWKIASSASPRTGSGLKPEAGRSR